MKVDVAIIGAGPSGASCAFHAARQGLRVLVLERQSLPRTKLCSGVLTAYSQADALNLLSPEALDAVTTGWFSATRLGLGRTVRHRRTRLVERRRFDDALVRSAEAVGAEVRDGVRVLGWCKDGVGLATSAGPVRCDMVVDASGYAAILGRDLQGPGHRALGIETRADMGAHAEGMRAEDPETAFLDLTYPGGYVWTFPHDSWTAVGGGTFRPESWAGLPTALTRYFEDEGYTLRQRFPGHHLRYSAGRVTGERLLLVGEAAGALDQATGEGIRFALWSGRLAGKALGLGPERAAPAYRALYREQLRPVLRLSEPVAWARGRWILDAALRSPLGDVLARHFLGS